MFKLLKDFTPPHGYKIGLYLRSATGDQSQVEKQEIKLKAFVLEQNLHFNFGRIEKVFVDAPGSGTDPERPSFQVLLKSASDREIDLILVSDLPRLSRSLSTVVDILRLCYFGGCNLISLRENFHFLEDYAIEDFILREFLSDRRP